MEKNQLDPKIFVEQMDLLVDLQLRDEYRDGVIENFERIISIAQLVNEFELPENIEISTQFEPKSHRWETMGEGGSGEFRI